MESLTSGISQKVFPENEMVSGKSLRPGIIAEIIKDHPEFTNDQFLGLTELNFYRQRYIESTLKEELGALTNLEQDVLESFRKGEFVAENVDEDLDRNLYGDRITRLAPALNSP
jgi:hypothetical protein